MFQPISNDDFVRHIVRSKGLLTVFRFNSALFDATHILHRKERTVDPLRSRLHAV